MTSAAIRRNTQGCAFVGPLKRGCKIVILDKPWARQFAVQVVGKTVDNNVEMRVTRQPHVFASFGI